MRDNEGGCGEVLLSILGMAFAILLVWAWSQKIEDHVTKPAVTGVVKTVTVSSDFLGVRVTIICEDGRVIDGYVKDGEKMPVAGDTVYETGSGSVYVQEKAKRD